jgi:hypothetical protein
MKQHLKEAPLRVEGQGHGGKGKDDPGTEQRHGGLPPCVNSQGQRGVGKNGPGTERRRDGSPPCVDGQGRESEQSSASSDAEKGP